MGSQRVHLLQLWTSKKLIILEYQQREKGADFLREWRYYVMGAHRAMENWWDSELKLYSYNIAWIDCIYESWVVWFYSKTGCKFRYIGYFGEHCTS